MESVWILGSGGHAKVVIETIRMQGICEPAGVLDDDPFRLGASVLGVPVLGSTRLDDLSRLDVSTAVIAIGSNRVRWQIAERMDGKVAWLVTAHPASVVSRSAKIGEGTVVFAGAIVQPDVVIGRHVIVNTSSSIDHDCTIGDYAHIAPGVHLAGDVSVEEGAFLGIGSVVLPGRRIGAWATVGAGAVVTRDVPAGVTAIGSPARWTRDRGTGDRGGDDL